MWLNGTDVHNRNTFRRMIYVHGTAEEWRLGRPASYDCIRIGMHDVVDRYNRDGEDPQVRVIPNTLRQTREGRKYTQKGQGDPQY